MRRWIAIVAAVALVFPALVAGGVVSIRAQEGTPVAKADHPVVGAWLTDTNQDDPANVPAFFVFHSDGTYIQEEGDIGVGAWEPTGERTAALTILFRFTTEDGGVRLLKVRASVEVAEDGATFTAPYSLELTEPDGTISMQDTGVATGERITVEPLETPATPAAEQPSDAPSTSEASATPEA